MKKLIESVVNTVLFRKEFTASLLLGLLMTVFIEDTWMACVGVNVAWFSHNFTHNLLRWKKNSTRYGGYKKWSSGYD